MKLRVSLGAVAALLGAAALAAPALAMDQIHIPDASAAQNSGPPDALFDDSVPTTWQKKATDTQQSGLGAFHFSVNGSNGYSDGFGSAYGMQRPTGSQFQENATNPGSEFYNNGATVQLQPMPQ